MLNFQLKKFFDIYSLIWDYLKVNTVIKRLLMSSFVNIVRLNLTNYEQFCRYLKFFLTITIHYAKSNELNFQIAVTKFQTLMTSRQEMSLKFNSSETISLLNIIKWTNISQSFIRIAND